MELIASLTLGLLATFIVALFQLPIAVLLASYALCFAIGFFFGRWRRTNDSP